MRPLDDDSQLLTADITHISVSKQGRICLLFINVVICLFRSCRLAKRGKDELVVGCCLIALKAHKVRCVSCVQRFSRTS